ncbi:Arm DNA-binding domain-containing protein [Shewanella indica]|uniref:Arm DNA-binding domain-containing protein n=1 Tax=Shewanella indica TaxID=768528 RepID=UPI00399A552B
MAKDEPRKTADGNGLYFVVPASGEPFWILRFSINGCRPEMTIGSYPELSLADARDAAFTIFLYVNCKLKRLFE